MIKILLLSGYCIPFVSLAMNEDATIGTLWYYLIMIIGFCVLCYASAKSKNTWIVFVGNVLSFASSCIFAWMFQTPNWEYYFKPFHSNQLIVFETVVVFVVQIIIVNCVTKGKKELMK